MLRPFARSLIYIVVNLSVDVRIDIVNYEEAFSLLSKLLKKGVSITNVSVKVKPRVHGRNIVGQQLPILFMDLTSFIVRLHTLLILLHVIACCWELLGRV